MKAKEVFFIWWFILDVATTMVMAIIIIIICLNFGYWLILSTLILPSLVIAKLCWDKAITVPNTWNRIYEWNGKIMDPLGPGRYYPFSYFSFLSEGADVPMNRQIIKILIGVRDGLPLKIIDQYCYGTDSNVEPETGAALRLLCKLEFIIEEPDKLVYAQSDPYGYLVGLVEQENRIYALGLKSEEVIDKYTTSNWHIYLLPQLETNFRILDQLGVRLLSFMPVDVILTPEVEETRRLIDNEGRKAEIIKATLKNEVIREVGQRKILDAKIFNMVKIQKLSSDNDKVKVNSINAIKNGVGVNGVTALKMAMQEKTLEAVVKSSKEGNLTYLDGSDNTATQAVKFGWGINATNPKK